MLLISNKILSATIKFKAFRYINELFSPFSGGDKVSGKAASFCERSIHDCCQTAAPTIKIAKIKKRIRSKSISNVKNGNS